MLLQVIQGRGAVTRYFPIAVDPNNVVSVSYVDADTILMQPDRDEYVSAVTFYEPVLVGLTEEGEKRYLSDVFVTGHFQDISVGLGLDTDGSIKAQMEAYDD